MSAYQIDLDPVHAVVRLTVTVEIVTPELAEDIYKRLKQISSTSNASSRVSILPPGYFKGINHNINKKK